MKTSNSEEKPTAKYSIGIDLDGNSHELIDFGLQIQSEEEFIALLTTICEKYGFDVESLLNEELSEEDMTIVDQEIENIQELCQCATHENEKVHKETLKEIVGGDHITVIGNSAFDYCGKLTSITFPNVTLIDERAFASCYALETVNTPNVTRLNRDAFYDCKRLKTLSFPNLTIIDLWSFGSCGSLVSVECPNVTYVGEFAFYNCKEFQYISLPNVTFIGERAFDGCTKMSIDLPNMSREYIEANAETWGLGRNSGWNTYPIKVTCKDGEFILNAK